jgi:hypothetical protein
MFATSFIDLFFWLIVGHAVADFPAQSAFLATLKNHLKSASLGLGEKVWPWGLFYHSMIHGGFVAYATGYVWIGMLEAIAHAVIDYNKSAGRFGKNSFHIDQWLHIGCKVVWAVLALSVGKLTAE